MLIDELLLRNSIRLGENNPILRFYRFDVPTVTVGYGMWRKQFYSTDCLLPLVRRPTGGGVVQHGRDLIYALVVPLRLLKPLGRVCESYRLLHLALQEALAQFRVATQLFNGPCAQLSSPYCFDSPVLFDVMIGRRKIAGAGQKRTRDYLLQQGSIAWNILKEVSPNLSEENFQRGFARQLVQRFGISIKEIPFSDEETEEILVLCDGYARKSA